MELVKRKIGNLKTGTRFLHGCHSSVMIATDFKIKSFRNTKILCVSENGLTEFIDSDVEVDTFNQNIKEQFIGLSRKTINNVFSNQKHH